MIRAERFTSRLGAALSLMGVAIGLGNVWRFPYMMGSYGGSAFLLLYLGLTLLFAIPLLSAEWALGRSTRQGPIGSYRAVFGVRRGTALGLLLVVSVLVANSYYMVVIGNIGYSALFGLGRGFSADTEAAYHAGLADGGMQYGFALAVLAGGALVLALGINRGIEASSRWMVPVFGVVVLALVAYALGLDGAAARFAAFLRPDFSRIGVAEVFAALGQAFFSLSVGGTFMVAYGVYLDGRAPLRRMAAFTALGDAGAALLAALFLVPTMLFFGLDLASGPGLLFVTMPKLFALMPGGWALGSAFLLALLLMAFLSAVAGLLVCAGGLRDLLGERIGRRTAIAAVAALEALLMWPSAHSPALIGRLDLIFGSGMQIFGALVAVLGVGWSLDRAVSLAQLGGAGARAWLAWLRWAVPAVLLVILGLYLAEVLRGA